MATATPAARSLALVLGVMALASCASSSSGDMAAAPAPTAAMPATPPSPDPRIGLAAGQDDAAQAAWNMRLVSNTAPTDSFKGVTNSDLAFLGKYAIQGNYNGFQVWDISNPAAPTLRKGYFCPASQSADRVLRDGSGARSVSRGTVPSTATS